MTTRATQHLTKVFTLTGNASGNVSPNRAVKIVGHRLFAQCAAGDRVDGVSAHAAADGVALEVHLPPCVVPMLVGTGGLTAGASVKVVADGVTDAPTLGGGTTKQEVVGVAYDTGVIGDLAGVYLRPFTAVIA